MPPVSRISTWCAGSSRLHGFGADVVRRAGVLDTRGMQVEQLDALDATHPAAAAPGQRATLSLERHECLLGNGQLHLGASGCVDRFDIEHVRCAIDNALAQREAQRKHIEVDRGGHHHRMRDAVEDQCNRQLLDNAIGCLAGIAMPAAQDIAGDAAGMIGGGGALQHAFSLGGPMVQQHRRQRHHDRPAQVRDLKARRFSASSVCTHRRAYVEHSPGRKRGPSALHLWAYRAQL
jgi:hypothetical protein